MKSLARKSALAYKAKDNGLVVLEDINFESPKTKDFVKVLNGLSVADKKTLLVLPDSANKNVVLSGRNVKNAKITTADSLNTYDVLNADSLLISESSIEKLENLLK